MLDREGPPDTPPLGNAYRALILLGVSVCCSVTISAYAQTVTKLPRISGLSLPPASLFERAPADFRVQRFDEIASEPAFQVISSKSPTIFEEQPTPRVGAETSGPAHRAPANVLPQRDEPIRRITPTASRAIQPPTRLPITEEALPTPPPPPPQAEPVALADSKKTPTWWEAEVGAGLRPAQRQLHITLNTLLVGALANSAQIQLMSDAPLISETEITTADAAFDWTSFVDARWDDISEPVGSTLTTGGPDRLRDLNANVELGVRRRNTIGGEFEIGQRFGHQNTNSIYFIPQDQGTSRLTLSYTQPLLRGSGRVYNTSLTVLAHLRTKLDRKEFEAKLQDHLLAITQEYWTLYFERARFLQHQRLLKNGVKVLAELESRKDVDALQSQIVRARAAVENRRAQLVRSRLTIRMSEARVRALVNDPALGDTLTVELVPQEHLLSNRFEVNLDSAVSTALRSRPEIEVAIQDVKSASVRMNMGKREALPLLNVVLETYASGLEGDSNVGRAFTEQFTEGEPAYGIGLQYEYPMWNRAASSRIQKRRLELRRLQHQFRQTVETMKLEVELSVHQVNAAYEALDAKRRAMAAAADEVAYLYDRWLLLPVDSGSASFLLEDLLEAQDRLAESELGLLQALLDHNLAQVEFKRSVGTLLDHHDISIDRNCNCNLPQQQIFKSAMTPAADGRTASDASPADSKSHDNDTAPEQFPESPAEPTPPVPDSTDELRSAGAPTEQPGMAIRPAFITR